MAKEPVELGNDQTSLGFQADIDSMTEKFVNTIFDALEISEISTGEDKESNEAENQTRQAVQNIDNLTDEQVINALGLPEDFLDNIDEIERWLNSVGLSPDVIDLNRKTREDTGAEFGSQTNQSNVRPKVTLSEQLKEELRAENEKLKSEVKNQIPNPSSLESKSAKHTGGIRELLKMFAKAIYKILGFFAEKFVILLSPLITLTTQLFYNIPGPNLKNPFPIIPDVISFNIQTAMYALTPLQVIPIKNTIAMFIEQALEVTNVVTGVLTPIINFLSNPNSLIKSFMEKAFEDFNLPLPAIGLGILGMELPSIDHKGLFDSGALSITENFASMARDAAKTGFPFNPEMFKNSDMFKSGNPVDIKSGLKSAIGVDVNANDDGGVAELPLSDSPLLQEIEFMTAVQENPVLQLDIINTINESSDLGLNNQPLVREFYREPYVPTGLGIDNEGWQYTFDFFKEFDLHTSVTTTSGVTYFNINSLNQVLTGGTEKRGLWESIVEAELHEDKKFIKDFYDLLLSYENKPIPELAKFLFESGGAVAIGNKSFSEFIIDKYQVTPTDLIKVGVKGDDLNKQIVENTIDSSSPVRFLNFGRRVTLDEPIEWGLKNRLSKIYLRNSPLIESKSIAKLQSDDINKYLNYTDKEYKDLDSVIVPGKDQDQMDFDIRKKQLNNNFESSFKNTFVGGGVEWNGDELIAYRQILNNSQKRDYYFNRKAFKISEQKRKYFFYSLSDNERKFIVNTTKDQGNVDFTYYDIDKNDIQLKSIGNYRDVDVVKNYVYLNKDESEPIINHSVYGLSPIGQKLTSSVYTEFRVLSRSVFENFWRRIDDVGFQYYSRNSSSIYSESDLNTSDKHLGYSDIVPLQYDSEFDYEWEPSAFTSKTDWTSGHTNEWWDFKETGSTFYLSTTTYSQWTATGNANEKCEIYWYNYTDGEVIFQLTADLSVTLTGSISIYIGDSDEPDYILTNNNTDSLTGEYFYIDSDSYLKIVVDAGSNTFSQSKFKLTEIFISDTYISGVQSDPLEKNDSVFIKNELVEKLQRYEIYYSQRLNFNVPTNYFLLDGGKTSSDKYKTSYNDFKERNLYYDSFLTNNSNFTVDIQFDSNSKMENLFDFRLKDDDSLNSSDFYRVLKRAFQLNFFNNIGFRSRGNSANFKHGLNPDGSLIRFFTPGENKSLQTTEFDYKQFKLKLWNIIPKDKLQYFTSHNQSFVVYFKEFSEYKDYLTQSFSDTLRIANERLVESTTIRGVIDNIEFRKRVNKNVENDTDKRLPLVIDSPLYGKSNYGPDGRPNFKPPSIDSINDSLLALAGGLLSNGTGNIPGWVTWFLGTITFIKNLVTMPINMVLDLIETLMKIVKNAITLNLPGVIKEIVNLIKMLVPGLSFFKDLIFPFLAIPTILMLVDSISAMQQLGLNNKQEEFKNFKKNLSKKAQTGRTKKKTWFETVGLDPTVFTTIEEVKTWLNSVGLDTSALNDLSRFKQNPEVKELFEDILLGYIPDEAPPEDASDEEKKKYMEDLGKNFEQLLDDIGPAIPDLLSMFMKIIKIVITKAFPQFFMDVVNELFKWVLGLIFEAFPFLGGGDKSSEQDNIDSFVKSITDGNSDVLNIESINIDDKELQRRLRIWLESVGLNESVLNDVNRALNDIKEDL